MNRIDKVRNYNQILFAIAGTIGIVFILFAAFLTLEEMSWSFFNNNDDKNNGVLAISDTNQLLKDSLRKQIISFDGIQIIDSLSQTYLLQITQANLASVESINKFNGRMNTKSIGTYENFQGNIYNNLVVFNSEKGTSNIIFDNRISIKDFIIHESDSKKYIVIPACSVDSNLDRYLNSEDLQELFIYDVSNDKVNKIKANENYTTLNYFQPEKSNDLIVHFGIDRNKDGIFEDSKEPMIFFKINLKSMSLEEFVSEKDMNKLQELLEGK
ncbi:MAG: hypothetical protein KA536_05395 [Saprospiraceae bacterium]|nr:hypothetical protein [Saprospiraceae bacterium]